MSLPSLRRLVGGFALVASTFVAALAPTTASAVGSPPLFSNLFVFGDSLSDPGNTQALLAPYGIVVPDPGQPYLGGRYSDGLLWTELLATGLGLPGAANPLHLGGNNFAYAGARTGGAMPSLAGDPIPGVLYQTQTMWGSSYAAADPGALYVVVGGGNDMRDARTLAPGNSSLELAFRQLSAEAAVANLKSSLGLLASRGAKNVLISNLPDLGNTPEAVGLGVVAASSDASAKFNALMTSLRGYGTSLGLTMSFLDMAGAVQMVRSNPAAYGISNLNLPCDGFFGADGGIGMQGAACSVSAFSDALHPSARAHQIIAGAAFDALGVTPVPEPQTLALMLAGLVLVAGIARRRTAVAA